MTRIKLLLVTALAVVAAAIAGRTLSSGPEWLSGEAAQGSVLTGEVTVGFKSDYFPLD
jgi:hypothetical protein